VLAASIIRKMITVRDCEPQHPIKQQYLIVFAMSIKYGLEYFSRLEALLLHKHMTILLHTTTKPSRKLPAIRMHRRNQTTCICFTHCCGNVGEWHDLANAKDHSRLISKRI
jgi:hypothetical protein